MKGKYLGHKNKRSEGLQMGDDVIIEFNEQIATGDAQIRRTVS